MIVLDDARDPLVIDRHVVGPKRPELGRNCSGDRTALGPGGDIVEVLMLRRGGHHSSHFVDDDTHIPKVARSRLVWYAGGIERLDYLGMIMTRFPGSAGCDENDGVGTEHRKGRNYPRNFVPDRGKVYAES